MLNFSMKMGFCMDAERGFPFSTLMSKKKKEFEKSKSYQSGNLHNMHFQVSARLQRTTIWTNAANPT